MSSGIPTRAFGTNPDVAEEDEPPFLTGGHSGPGVGRLGTTMSSRMEIRKYRLRTNELTDGLTGEGARDTCVPKKFLLNDNIQDFQHAKYFRGWANKEASG